MTNYNGGKPSGSKVYSSSFTPKVMPLAKRWILEEGERLTVGQPDADVYVVLKTMLEKAPNLGINTGCLFIEGIEQTPARSYPIKDLMKIKGLFIDRAHMKGRKWQITDGKGYKEDDGNGGYSPEVVY